MKKTTVEIVEAAKNSYKVKFPFLKVPVEMDEKFFKNHLNNQAYKIVKGNNKYIEKSKAMS